MQITAADRNNSSRLSGKAVEAPGKPGLRLIERIDEQTNPAGLGVDALRARQGIDLLAVRRPLALLLIASG